MSGSVRQDKRSGRWYVRWWDRASHKDLKLYSDHRGYRIEGERQAAKFLTVIQAEAENGTLRIEKYTKEIPTDVIPYLYSWLSAIKSTIKPGTYKDYLNSIRNHLEPFFRDRRIDLKDIRHDTLMALLASIKRGGKGKLNTMYALRACLDYAWRSDRIPVMPPFPRRSSYQIETPAIKWITEDRQMRVIEAIPEVHRPIFLWLKYHYRRPGEACALQKVDWDGNVWTIRRSFSDRVLVDSTKTGEIHTVPCHPLFRTTLAQIPKSFSPFFFVNPNAKRLANPDRHYSVWVLERMWNRACEKVGEKITLYAGLKHSSCTQALQAGLSPSEVQILTDHARLDSVRRYAKIEVAKRRELQEKVVRLAKNPPKAQSVIS